jgi:hypothetical protein
MQQGDFIGARKAVRCCVSGGGDCPNPRRLHTLQSALHVISHPPIANTPDRYTESYDEAIEHAESARGRERLTWMRDNRQQRLIKQIEQAEELMEEIDELARQWDVAENDLTGLLQGMGAIVNKSQKGGMFSRGGLNKEDRQVLEARVQEAMNLLRRMETELCPMHPHLMTFRNNAVLRQAIQLTE